MANARKVSKTTSSQLAEGRLARIVQCGRCKPPSSFAFHPSARSGLPFVVEVMIILFFCLRACDGDCSCGVPLQVWEAIAGLSVLHFYNVRQLNCTALLLQATTSTDDPPKTGRVGTGDPPVDLEAWRRMFWICGSCPLQRYGSSGDGGYLLCDLQNATMAAAYSFGIDGRDEWGQEVASCTGATLFQFDCFNTTGAECRSQNMCPPTNFRACRY